LYFVRLAFRLMSLSPLEQSAAKGVWSEVMCVTKDGLEQRALHGPTCSAEFVGPVGQGTLNAHAHDKPVMERLWNLSENDAGFAWTL
jgi:hypothetical protein